tara:strand:+ start:1538 stop:2131 length:594 start_codon:yes stop_codon:yes gene_type:complete
MDIRNIFFKFRSFTPIPIALAIIYNSHPILPFNVLGVLLIIAGEMIRINAVRYAGGATRTRNVGAPFLCTSGPYSYTRNPLYWGNLIIYTGVAFFGGGQWMWHLIAIIIIFFIVQYYFIISLEQETLKLKYREEYESYTENVPKLLPKLTPWDSGNNIEPQNLYKTLKTEKRTLQNILLIFILTLFKSQIISLFNFL